MISNFRGNKMKYKILFKFIMWVIIFVNYSLYGIPNKIYYQGRITDKDKIPVTGTVDFVFNIYDAYVGGNLLWSETHNSVSVIRGVFNVILGSSNPINLSFNTNYWLEINLNGSVLTPRRQFLSAAYAYRAQIANEVSSNLTIKGSLTVNNNLFVSNKTFFYSDVTITNYSLYLKNGSKVLTLMTGGSGIDIKTENSPLYLNWDTGENVTIGEGDGNANLIVYGSGVFKKFLVVTNAKLFIDSINPAKYIEVFATGTANDIQSWGAPLYFNFSSRSNIEFFGQTVFRTNVYFHTPFKGNIFLITNFRVDGETNLTSTVYSDIDSLTFTLPVGYNYTVKIEYSANFKSPLSQDFYIVPNFDLIDIGEAERQIYDDDHYHPVALSVCKKLIAGGSHTVKIRGKTSGGGTAYIKKRSLLITVIGE